ncbi:hypothetical protein, partial [Escherichia coli]|uniref:hypothetical protein n=1 Tax=Escherichia coli TaxID=562 RepID=UPI00289C5311
GYHDQVLNRQDNAEIPQLSKELRVYNAAKQSQRIAQASRYNRTESAFVKGRRQDKRKDVI